MTNKRYEVIAGNNGERDIAIIGTAHNEKEKFSLLFKALKDGFDFIQAYEY